MAERGEPGSGGSTEEAIRRAVAQQGLPEDEVPDTGAWGDAAIREGVDRRPESAYPRARKTPGATRA